MNLSSCAVALLAVVSIFGEARSTSVHDQTNDDRELQGCPFANTPAEPCCAYFALGYDPFNFEDYPVYFSESTTFTLAQTGTFTGPDDIEEYVRFATDSSPYIDAYEGNLGANTAFGGYDGNTCTFIRAAADDYTFSADLIDGSEARVISMSKLKYATLENKITRVDIFYTAPWFEFFFVDKASTPEVNEFICDVMAGPCDFKVGNTNACVNKLSKSMPITTNGTYVDGNSQGCRALHAVFAETNPTAHCAHIKFQDAEDPSGRVKCSESEGVTVDDLFSDSDFAVYNLTCTQNDIDPEVGYVVL